MADAAPGRFEGFPREAFAFFKALAKNNDREWFQAHKDVYERTCRDTLRALTIALDPPLGAGRLTRINRDLRFSKDKSPYRTNVSAVVRGNYLSLSADGLYVGAGVYMLEPTTLRRLRAAIDDTKSGAALVQIVTRLRRKGYTVDTHERVASVPRGYRADHPRLEFLRMKDIHAGKMFAPAPWLSTAAAAGRVEAVFTDVAPLQAWLKRHIGSGRA